MASKKKIVKKTAKKVAKKATKKVAKKATKKVANLAKKATKKVAKKATKKVAKKATKKIANLAKKATRKVAKKATKKVANLAKKATKKVAKKATTKAPAGKQVANKEHAIKALPAGRLGTMSAAMSAFVAPPPARAAGHVVVPERSKTVSMRGLGAYAPPPPSHAAAVTLIPKETAARRAAARASFVAGDVTEDFAQVALASALDKKADNGVILRVTELTSYADFFVIVSALSERQVQAIAKSVADDLQSAFGRQPMAVDGREQGNWVVVDYGSVVVHCFLEQARAYYDLDGFWHEAPKVDFNEDRGLAALAHYRELRGASIGASGDDGDSQRD